MLFLLVWIFQILVLSVDNDSKQKEKKRVSFIKYHIEPDVVNHGCKQSETIHNNPDVIGPQHL